MVEGEIFNIMKYSIHDGPGIRTTIFFKGCPLNCQWCHNPEGQGFGQELMYRPERCVGCWQCLEICPSGATILVEGKLGYLRDKCLTCGECCTVCHAEARELVAKKMSVSEVMAEIEKDVIFYDESGGGVTFSGGEAMMQPEFLLELLKNCRKKEIHTAVETCGLVSLGSLQMISNYVDIFLYDVKLMDSGKHQDVTGVPNELILSNLRWLSEHYPKIIVRVAIIPGINDDEENIHQSKVDLPSDKIYNKNLFVSLKQEGQYYVVDQVSETKPKQGVYLKGKFQEVYNPMNESGTFRVDDSLDKYFVEQGSGKDLEQQSFKGGLVGTVKVLGGYGVLTGIAPR